MARRGVTIVLTEEQEQWMRDNYCMNKSLSECSEYLGVSKTTAYYIAKDLGLTKTGCGNALNLPDSAIEWIKSHYHNTKNDVILAKFKISNSSLHRIKRIHGLEKTKQFMKKTQREGSEAARAYWENLKKNDPEAYERQRDIQRRNLKWDDPENHNRFEKGVSVKDRIGAKRWSEANKKRMERMAEIRASERVRVRMGKDQKTKLKIGLVKIEDPNRKYVYQIRHYMAEKYGYVPSDDHIREMYYSADTRRNLIAEKRYSDKCKIRFKPLDAEEEVKEKKVINIVPDWSDTNGGLNAI